MASLDNIEKLLKDILQSQKEINSRINKIENTINKIESDIYLDEELDFEIMCPYCNYEFTVDMDEEKKEVICPECENIIELDFTGNVDDSDIECGTDGCTGCKGCNPFDNYNDDDM